MDTLRSVSHLQRELGDELFNALVSSDNTSKVKEFCEGLLEDALPTELTNIGPENRNYDILNFLEGNEKRVIGHIMVERAVKMNADLGEDDGQYLLDNQQDIPVALRKVVFVFTGWRRPDSPGRTYCVYWNGGSQSWSRYFGCMDDDGWGTIIILGIVFARVLRRK